MPSFQRPTFGGTTPTKARIEILSMNGASPTPLTATESFGTNGGAPPGGYLEFPFNPETLKVVRSAPWEDRTSPRTRWAPLSYRGARTDDLDFTVLLDESEYRSSSALAGAGAAALFAAKTLPGVGAVAGLFVLENEQSVMDCIHGLRWLTFPMAFEGVDGIGVAIGSATPPTKKAVVMRPPTVLFKWADFCFLGVVDKVSANLLLFHADGTPRRATVDVSIKGRLIHPQRANVDTQGMFAPADESTIVEKGKKS